MRQIQVLFLLLLLNLYSYNLKGQLFSEIEANTIYPTDFESSVLFKNLEKYTYSFCQKGRKVEWNHLRRAKNATDLYKIIAIYDSKDTTYCHKLLISRIQVKNGISYVDSTPKYTVEIEDFDIAIGWQFFTNLSEYKFHKLDNKCLINRDIPQGKYTKSLIITDYHNEEVYLQANKTIRKLTAWSPETFFWDYPEYVKNYPGQNICRAIYIICRNDFVNKIWKSNEP